MVVIQTCKDSKKQEIFSRQRIRIEITGFVQGVGFRPFVCCLARQLELTGWICNDSSGVEIEIAGSPSRLDAFLEKLKSDKPSIARIDTCNVSACELQGMATAEIDFIIKSSDRAGKKTAVVLPDLATCDACRQELFDPNDRRYLYPFINCTQCGPRFSIIKKLPYDRCNTSMSDFPMCSKCLVEYNNINSRRFHAQPNACWDCGPSIVVMNANGEVLAKQVEALTVVCDALQAGKIVAAKGIGGFHLFVDASNGDAVLRLRQRKFREDKPLALMLPSINAVQAICHVTDFDSSLLQSVQAPIVLLDRRDQANNLIAKEIAPNNPYLGVMLPYSPLHHVLLNKLNFPLVATSGNISGQPICIDEAEALDKLGEVADLFLMHNRHIVNRIDDSVVRAIYDKKLFLRRARGFAPFYCKNSNYKKSILAVGGHLKNTFAFADNQLIFLSQHIGDLDNIDALQAFEASINNTVNLHEFSPSAIACDMHPDYLSSKYATQHNSHTVKIQHHHAHVTAVMLEHKLKSQVLGIAWDGSGLGLDNTIWGGEFITATYKEFTRVGYLRSFLLPGGELAIKEPQRIAIGMLHQLLTAKTADDWQSFAYLPVINQFSNAELKILQRMITSKLNTPVTSSIGRLFDGIAAIIGLRYKVNFEGQAAMELEFVAKYAEVSEVYEFYINEQEKLMIDWQPMLQGVLRDVQRKVAKNIIARKFHNTLIDIIVAVALKVGIADVVLSGGCFQNKILLVGAIEKLQKNGFAVYWPEEIPMNDGGIAFGQLAIANARL